MAEIKDIKVWKNATKTECRIYVHTTDNREGVYYFKATRWNEKGWAGSLTNDEIERAKILSIWDNKYHTIYENEMADRIAVVDLVENIEEEDKTVSESEHTEIQDEKPEINQQQKSVSGFFDDFFNDGNRDYSVCLDCGKPHNHARFLFSTEGGNQAWVCAECAAKRDAESRERAKKEARRVEEMARRDAWEEN